MSDGEANVEDSFRDVCVILHVDDVHVVLGGRDDGSNGWHKAVVERWQEGFLWDIIKADGDAVEQHVLRHQAYKQPASRLHLIDTIWKHNNSHILTSVYLFFSPVYLALLQR